MAVIGEVTGRASAMDLVIALIPGTLLAILSFGVVLFLAKGACREGK